MPDDPRSRWNARYAADEYVYGTAPNDFLAEVAPRLPPGPVLCLADGEGRNGVFLAERGHPVTSVDLSAEGLRKVERLAAERGVEVRTVEADLAEHRIEPEAWSGIVAIFAHLPPEVRARVHRAAVAGLREGGAFVLEAYTPRQFALGTGGPPQPLAMELTTLREELAGLRLEIARELRRELREGSLHHGPGEVVQLLGWKETPPSTNR